MSILIKGVEMPKGCEECFAREHIEADTDHCAFDYCVFENWHQPRTPLVLTPKELKSKAPYCPLVPVPPHGRLIDANEIKKTIRPITEEDDFNACTIRTVKELMKNHIDNAPTIIEAEEGE